MPSSKLNQIAVYVTAYVFLIANVPKPLQAQFGNLKERMIKAAVCALTANAVSTDRELCFSSGIDDYLSKPIELQD